MSDLTHMNQQGRAKMVDVSDKTITQRMAIATSKLTMSTELFHKIERGEMKKGDVLSVAQVAGIMAAKQTAQLIPMCHQLPLSGVDIHFEGNIIEDQAEIEITATVKTTAQTGVEMEALTAVSVAALTIYDMGKAVDKSMVIGPTRLLQKQGGKSGDYLVR